MVSVCLGCPLLALNGRANGPHECPLEIGHRSGVQTDPCFWCCSVSRQHHSNGRLERGPTTTARRPLMTKPPAHGLVVLSGGVGLGCLCSAHFQTADTDD